MQELGIDSCDLLNSLTDCQNDFGEQRRLIRRHLQTHSIQFGLEFSADSFWINRNFKLTSLLHSFIVLDFFTYCCINCLHVLPYLEEIHQSFRSRLVVIGVHSAKFPHEKQDENLRSAVSRYGINHAVVSDPDGRLWECLGVTCWPTVIVCVPGYIPVLSVIGETQIKSGQLRSFISLILSDDWLMKDLSINNVDVCDSLEDPHKVEHVQETSRNTGLVSNFTSIDDVTPSDSGLSVIPTSVKILATLNSLVVCDIGNHTVMLLEKSGKVLHSIGSGVSGLRDGFYDEAQFSYPHDACISACDNIIYVADTWNNAVRLIDLRSQTVFTLCRFDTESVASPWALCLVDSVLFVAAAGMHQIWAYFFTDTTLFAETSYGAGTLCAVAGSGSEGAHNHRDPLRASFAQPSALCHSRLFGCLLIADSESSSVRYLCLRTGSVGTVAGGSMDPTNLFHFGDVDFVSHSSNSDDTDSTSSRSRTSYRPWMVRLQHPLGITVDDSRGHIYVSDSYNNCVKKITGFHVIHGRKVPAISNMSPDLRESVRGLGSSGIYPAGDRAAMSISCTRLDVDVQSSEAAGVLYLSTDHCLYLADTNNSRIVVVDLDSLTTSSIHLYSITRSVDTRTAQTAVYRFFHVQTVTNFCVKFHFPSNYSISREALNFWKLETEGADAGACITPKCGHFSDSFTFRCDLATCPVAGVTVFRVSARLTLCARATTHLAAVCMPPRDVSCWLALHQRPLYVAQEAPVVHVPIEL